MLDSYIESSLRMRGRVENIFKYIKVALSNRLSLDKMVTYFNKNKNISEIVLFRGWSLNYSYHISFSFYSEVRVEGLETLDYLENKERFTEQGDAITFESEVSILSADGSTISFHCFSTYD